MPKAKDSIGSREDRVVVLVDLDCFYCQVEHLRLGIPLDQPLAVRQWDGLIAVNYAARKQGISKLSTVDDAERKCPNIKMVHVEVIASKEDQEQIDRELEKCLQLRDSSEMIKLRSKCKASLERYREQSFKIMQILEEESKGNFERASIDEAFLDLTEMIDAEFEFGLPEENSIDWNGKIITSDLDEPQDFYSPRSPMDFRMMVASRIVHRIRSRVFNELGFTCSAGIGPNKMISKLVCSYNKPNGQTCCLPSSIPRLFSRIPLSSIRFLGGKLGKALENLVHQKLQISLSEKDKMIVTPAMICQNFSPEELGRVFDQKTAGWLLDCCQGIDHEPLQDRTRIKSLTAAKSFTTPLTTLEELSTWIEILCNEIINRGETDRNRFQRMPSTLTLHMFNGTRSCNYPCTSNGSFSSNQLVQSCWKLFEKFGGINFLQTNKCSRLQVTASQFRPLPGSSADEIGCKQITQFFGQRPSQNFQAEAEDEDLQLFQTDTEQAKDEISDIISRADSNTYFESFPVSESNNALHSNNSKIPCEFCSELIDPLCVQEHKDFHFARDLQEMENSRVRALDRNLSSVSSRKRPKSSSSSQKKSSSVSIRQFFSRSDPKSS